MKNKLVDSFFEDGIKNPKNKSFYNNFYTKKNKNDNLNKEIEYYENKIKELNNNKIKETQEKLEKKDALDNYLIENKLRESRRNLECKSERGTINNDYEDKIEDINYNNLNDRKTQFINNNNNSQENLEKLSDRRSISHRTNKNILNTEIEKSFYNYKYNGYINDDPDFYDNNRILNKKLNAFDHINVNGFGTVNDKEIKKLKQEQEKSFKIALENQIKERMKRKELQNILSQKEKERERLKLEKDLKMQYKLDQIEKINKKNTQVNTEEIKNTIINTENKDRDKNIKVLKTERFELEMQKEKEMMKELPNIIEKQIKKKLDEEINILKNEIYRNSNQLNNELINIKNQSNELEIQKKNNLSEIQDLRKKLIKMQYVDEVKTNELLYSISRDNHLSILPNSNLYNNPSYLMVDNEVPKEKIKKFNYYDDEYDYFEDIETPKKMYSYNYFIPLDYEINNKKYKKYKNNNLDLKIDDISLNMSNDSIIY